MFRRMIRFAAFVFACKASVVIAVDHDDISWLEHTPLEHHEIGDTLNLRYVFVAGFLNESIPFYFTDNQKSLQANGIAEDRIHRIYPPSNQRIIAGSDFVKDRMDVLLAKDERELVLIGHSKGAVEALLYAIRNSEVIKERVRAVILIQGAFRGSAVADYLANQSTVIPDNRMPWHARLSFLAYKYMSYIIHPFVIRGLSSLLTSRTEKILRLHYTFKPDAATNLRDKVFYVTSARRPHKIADLIRTTAYYLHTYFGPSDGLVLKRDQSLPWVGRVIADLNADHAGLTTSFPVSNAHWSQRHSFTTNLLRFVARF